MSHTVILYYKYAAVADPKGLLERQRALCERLGLKGRILVAEEGINGTLEGDTEKIEEYITETKKEPGFSDIHWKRSPGDGNTFPKLVIKVRKDIVSNAIENWGVDPRQKTATHLSPKELHEWFLRGEKFEIIDMRNDYEHASGHFHGSILPAMKRFRDLPALLGEWTGLKKKKVLTVCTGGVRCEKASALLLKHGFEDVYQLDGGIVSYMEQFPNEHFDGSLYVFDNRKTVGFETESEKHQVIGKCLQCKTATNRYVNCSNQTCHGHFISCDTCTPLDRTRACSFGCKIATLLATLGVPQRHIARVFAK